ncbi:MAG TPA: hypothetical protein VJH70_00510 [Candidatus Paceibacterota bacterium]
MWEKLKSVLAIPQLQLTLRSIAFGAALYWLRMSEFSWVSLVVFLGIIGFTFFRVHPLSMFVVLGVLLGMIRTLDSFWFISGAAISGAVFFYLSFGIRQLVFVHRIGWYAVRNVLLLYFTYLLFFITDKSTGFWWQFLLVLAAVFILIYEWLILFERSFPKRYLIAALAMTFLIGELLWSTALLPLGLINNSSLLILCTYILVYLTHHHFHGTLQKALSWKNAAIFLMTLLVIFWSASWKL